MYGENKNKTNCSPKTIVNAAVMIKLNGAEVLHISSCFLGIAGALYSPIGWGTINTRDVHQGQSSSHQQQIASF